MDHNFNKLLEENVYYKDCLKNIYKELNVVLAIKREKLRSRKGFDSEMESAF